MPSSSPIHLDDILKDDCLVLLSHPGLANTNIVNGQDSSFSNFIKKGGRKFMYLTANNMFKSSLTTMVALSSDKAEPLDNYVPRSFFHINGYPKKIKTSSKKYRDEELYRLTEELISKN